MWKESFAAWCKQKSFAHSFIPFWKNKNCEQTLSFSAHFTIGEVDDNSIFNIEQKTCCFNGNENFEQSCFPSRCKHLVFIKTWCCMKNVVSVHFTIGEVDDPWNFQYWTKLHVSQVGMEVLSKVCLFGIKLQSFFNIRKIKKCFSVSFTIGEVDDHWIDQYSNTLKWSVFQQQSHNFHYFIKNIWVLAVCIVDI